MKSKTSILKTAHELLSAIIIMECKNHLAIIIISLHLLETYLSAHAHAARPAPHPPAGAPVPP
jgi:hypothetical protein